jgi:hypothetical protein
MPPPIEFSAATAEENLKKFFSGCESKFRFLEQMHGFSYLSGLVEQKNNCKIIMPYRNQPLADTYSAVTRYEKHDTAFEISYGNHSSLIECLVYYGPILRFSLDELLIAGRRSQKAKARIMPLSTPDTQTALVEIAETIQNNADLILEPPEKMIARAQSIRENRLETAIRKNFSERLKTLAFSAARAYREKNFRQVIALLEPYKNHLSSADLKKLQLAKKQLLS